MTNEPLLVLSEQRLQHEVQRALAVAAATQTVAHRGLPPRVHRGTHPHGPRLPCHRRGLRAGPVSWWRYRRVSRTSLDLDSGQLAWRRVTRVGACARRRPPTA